MESPEPERAKVMYELTQKSYSTNSDLIEKSQAALKAVKANKQLGFVQLPARDGLWESCEKLAYEWRKKVSHFVILGIGGSSLGSQVIMETFGLTQFTFIDNVDPVDFYAKIEKLPEWEQTGWIVISKSGNTMETLCALEMIQQYGRNRYGSDRLKFCTVITENTENPLSKWGYDHHCEMLEIPKDVGGRYSVLTPVGMFIAALAGLQLEAFKKGAQQALQSETLISNLIAQTVSSFERQEYITVFWIYNNRGLFMGRWIQQLWAESLGKKKTRSGKPSPRVSTPMAALGATDQHSVLQQMMEGHNDKFYWFFRFDHLENDPHALKSVQIPHMKWLENYSMGSLLKAEATATRDALIEEGRQVLTLQAKTLDEASLGFFFMMMELVVAGIAEVLDLNAFDQPGVELGKRLAKQQFVSHS